LAAAITNGSLNGRLPGYLRRIVGLDARVADGALESRVPK